jgi:hypothetical protein
VKRKSNKEIVRVEDVYTPTTIPTITFIERGGFGRRLTNSLKTKAQPICVEGPFKSGKTTIVRNKVKELFPKHIYIPCSTTSTFEQLLVQAFNDLGVSYSMGTEVKTAEGGAGIKADLWPISAHLGDKVKETVSHETPVVAPQPTSQSLFAGAGNAPWIVDDAHKLAPDVFASVAKAMREWQSSAFGDNQARIIVIASEQWGKRWASEITKVAKDLNQRLARITTTMMSDSELEQVIRKGAEALNVDFSAIEAEIKDVSIGNAGVCHYLCLHCCLAANVLETQYTAVRLTADHLETALDEYLRTCGESIDEAFSESKSKATAVCGNRFFGTVLDLVSEQGPDGIPYNELVKQVAAIVGTDIRTVGDGIMAMSDEDVGVIRQDGVTGDVCFKEPLYLIYYKRDIGQLGRLIKRKSVVDKFLKIVTHVEGGDVDPVP